MVDPARGVGIRSFRETKGMKKKKKQKKKKEKEKEKNKEEESIVLGRFFVG